jgi:MFS family permease
LLFFALFGPAFFLAPLAGVAADRFDRKRIVLLCYAGVALACGALAVFTVRGAMTPSLLLLISCCMGIAFAFSGPSNFSIAANSVPPEDLASAVSLQSAANNLTRVVGPLLAAPFVAMGRFEISFSVYLVAAVLAGFLVAAMRVALYTPDEEETGIFSRMANGLGHARERRPALPALITVGVLSFFGVSHVVLLPAFAQDVLGDKNLFVWMVAASGIGAMAGALGTGRPGRHLSLRRSTLESVGFGATLAVFAVAESVWLALLTQLFIGYFYFSIMTNLQTLIQQVVDEGKRGRVMSLFQAAWGGLVPFGGLSMGFLAGPIGTSRTILIAAAICVLYGILMTALSPRLERPTPAEAAG